MAKLKNRTVIGIVQETTQGTPVAVTATDFILAQDVEIKPVVEILKRDYKRNSLDTLAHVPGKRSYEVKFKTEIKGSGAAGTAYTPLGAAIQACGFSETVSPATSVTYAPISAAPSANFYGPGKSVTLEVYLDGLKHIIAGCVGDMNINCDGAGKIALAEFSFKGLYAAPSDASAGTQTYLSTLPPIVASATLTLAGTATHVASKLQISCGNSIAMRESLNSAGGVLGFQITGRDPVGSCDPEAVAVATDTFIAKLVSGAVASSSIVIGATAGNITTITCPKTQYSDAPYGDRSELLIHQLGLRFSQNAGDDWISIVQT